jgi:hypothetical protein
MKKEKKNKTYRNKNENKSKLEGIIYNLSKISTKLLIINY